MVVFFSVDYFNDLTKQMGRRPDDQDLFLSATNEVLSLKSLCLLEGGALKSAFPLKLMRRDDGDI